MHRVLIITLQDVYANYPPSHALPPSFSSLVFHRISLWDGVAAFCRACGSTETVDTTVHSASHRWHCAAGGMVARKQAAMVPCVRSCDGRSEWACARCGIFASRLHDVAATVLAMGVEAIWRLARRDTIARLLSASVCMGWHEHHLYLHLLSREWPVGGYSGVSFGHSHNACVYVQDEFHELLCSSQAIFLVCVCVCVCSTSYTNGCRYNPLVRIALS